MHAVALTTRQNTYWFLLVPAFEIKSPHISATGHCTFAKLDHIKPVGYFLPNGFLRVQCITRLVDIADFNRFPHFKCATIRRFTAGQHSKQRGFACPISPDNANNATRWQAKGQVFNQKFVAIALVQAFSLDHNPTKARTGRDRYLRLAGLLFG